jgi:hypothetical protein
MPQCYATLWPLTSPRKEGRNLKIPNIQTPKNNPNFKSHCVGVGGILVFGISLAFGRLAFGILTRFQPGKFALFAADFPIPSLMLAKTSSCTSLVRCVTARTQ